MIDAKSMKPSGAGGGTEFVVPSGGEYGFDSRSVLGSAVILSRPAEDFCDPSRDGTVSFIHSIDRTERYSTGIPM